MINLTSKKVLLSIGNLIAKNPIKLHYSCLKNIDNKLNSGNVFERRYLSNFVIKDVHEPSYLDYLQPQIPFFDLVNVQVSVLFYCSNNISNLIDISFFNNQSLTELRYYQIK